MLIYVPVKRRATLDPKKVQEIAESILQVGLQSPILGQAAHQPPFRRPKRSRHGPLAIAPTGQLVGVAT